MIVQHIETRWTKRSRGMPGAAARNAVPHALPLPLMEGPTGAFHLHRVTIHEEEGFFPYQRTAMGTEVEKYWSLTFVPAGDAVAVRFQYDFYEHGYPYRRATPHRLFTLAPGEVGVLHINGRFSAWMGEYYAQHFVNIAHADAVPANLFTDFPPHYFVDRRAKLF